MKKLTVLLIAALLLLAAVPSSYAEFRGIFKNKKIVEELKLSDDQVETIKELLKSNEKKMIQLRADTEMKEIDLREILDEDEPDESKAVALVKDIMKLKTDQKVLKIRELIQIKKTLTPDQIEKFHEIKHEHGKHMKGMRKGKKGHGPHPERD
jgi:Spy/CpxP family protein refolding chaperone